MSCAASRSFGIEVVTKDGHRDRDLKALKLKIVPFQVFFLGNLLLYEVSERGMKYLQIPLSNYISYALLLHGTNNLSFFFEGEVGFGYLRQIRNEK